MGDRQTAQKIIFILNSNIQYIRDTENVISNFKIFRIIINTIDLATLNLGKNRITGEKRLPKKSIYILNRDFRYI